MVKKILIWLSTGSLLFAAVCMAGEAPHQVGPFILNRDIADFKDFVILETAIPIRYMENVEEVEIKPIEGFKSGLISYGTCQAAGHILRIKLKYSDSSKKFFEQILKQIKNRFGDPDEYLGDPFHIAISWKWTFVDKDNNKISLTIQHNTLDEEEKKGNAIKLTSTTMIEKDRDCHNQKDLDQRERLRRRKWKAVSTGLEGWDRFVPR